MHALATAGSAPSLNIWAYLAVFAAVLIGWGGVPGIGTAVIAAATVAASQGELNIAGVLVAAVLGAEAGGLAGYSVGSRWGRALLSRPGPLLARRLKVLTGGEALFAKWGRLAVFFTPCLISGIARMRYSQFVIWNFLAGAVYVVAVGFTSYGAGKGSTGHNDPVSVGALVVGLVAAVAAVLLGRRYHRRRSARRAGATPPLGADMPAVPTAEQEG